MCVCACVCVLVKVPGQLLKLYVKLNVYSTRNFSYFVICVVVTNA